MDEPSSALDPRAEDALFQAIRDRQGTATTILITHRLANVRHADVIYILDRGGSRPGNRPTTAAVRAILIVLASRGQADHGGGSRCDRRSDRRGTRRETRTVNAVTVRTPGGIAFPHAEQAVRVTRTRIVAGKTSRETAYLTVSLPTDQAPPGDLQDWIRRHWHIENMIHYVRDVTFREDLHQARTGTGPAVIATLRNTAIGYHRTNGATNIARATRQANRRSHDLITTVTSNYQTTQ